MKGLDSEFHGYAEAAALVQPARLPGL